MDLKPDGCDDSISDESHTPTPATRHRGFAQALAGHAVSTKGGKDINFSRKRNLPSPPSEFENAITPTDPKRHKKANLPLPDSSASHENVYPPTDSADGTPLLLRRSSLVDRPSKFQEASMHDRPSEKPPSVFTRVFSSRANQSMDKMMDEYMDTQREAPKIDTGRSSNRATQLFGLTHHPNTSISSNATLAMSTDSRHSGVVRFGRSIASSINPAHIWQKVTTWRDGKTEQGDDDENEMVQRQIRAEQVYAELKRAGQLGKLGSRTGNKHVSAPGYMASTDDLSKQRNSGISTTSFDTASTTSLQQRVSAVPGSAKKSSNFGHFRSPSLQNLRNPLKKAPSEASIHRRTASESMSPEKQPGAPESVPLLRPSSSKKDLLKQVKLSRRVSDLEAKLEHARRELDIVRSNTSGVPPIPEVRPVSRSNARRRFAPLPTLPSESLLAAEMSRPKTATGGTNHPTFAIGRDLPGLQMADPALPQAMDVEVLDAPQLIKDPVSAFESSSVEPSPEKSPRKALKKRKSSAIEASYRLNKVDTDVMDLDPPTAKLRKTRNASKPKAVAISLPNPNPPNLPKPRPKVLTKPHPSIALAGKSADTHVGLETVQEEGYVSTETTTTKLPLNGSPTRSTAVATPAHPRMPHHRHVRSMSPVKTPRVPLGDTYGMDQVFINHYPTCSTSPASRMSPSGLQYGSTKENDSPIRLRPNGLDIPQLPMPMCDSGFEGEQQPKKQEWEWPDDVF